jgi:hypothetical protein
MPVANTNSDRDSVLDAGDYVVWTTDRQVRWCEVGGQEVAALSKIPKPKYESSDNEGGNGGGRRTSADRLGRRKQRSSEAVLGQPPGIRRI